MATEKGTTIRVTLQQLAMLIGVAAGSTGGYKLFVEPKPNNNGLAAAGAVGDSPDFVLLNADYRSHDRRQIVTESDQKRIDGQQDQVVQMLNEGINRIATTMSGVEAKLGILLRQSRLDNESASAGTNTP